MGVRRMTGFTRRSQRQAMQAIAISVDRQVNPPVGRVPGSFSQARGCHRCGSSILENLLIGDWALLNAPASPEARGARERDASNDGPRRHAEQRETRGRAGGVSNFSFPVRDRIDTP